MGGMLLRGSQADRRFEWDGLFGPAWRHRPTSTVVCAPGWYPGGQGSIPWSGSSLEVNMRFYERLSADVLLGGRFLQSRSAYLSEKRRISRARIFWPLFDQLLDRRRKLGG